MRDDVKNGTFNEGLNEAEAAALAFARARLAALPPVAYSEGLRLRRLVGGNYMENGPINIVVVGDSVSHGWMEGEMTNNYATWHNRLRLMINTVWPAVPVNIINTAVGGVCADYAVAHYARDVRPHRADLVIAAYGLNDVNGPREAFAANMTEIARLSRADGTDIVFLSENMLNTRYDPEGTPPQHAAYAHKTAAMQNAGQMDAYVATLREVAAAERVPLADAYALWRGMADAGIDTTALLCNRINHPGAAMHTVFAETVYHCLFGETFPGSRAAGDIGDGMIRTAEN